MSKKAIKIITIISFLIMIIVIASFNYNVFGFDPNLYKPDSKVEATGADTVESIANRVIGPIRIIANIISIVMLVVIGIKYILGSIEERAEYKKTMKPYLIGAVIVFGITNLLGVLIAVIETFN